jgi:hypothetical protein
MRTTLILLLLGSWANNAEIFWLIFACGFCCGFVVAGLLYMTIDNWKETSKLFKK